jgi:hypothetical protein
LDVDYPEGRDDRRPVMAEVGCYGCVDGGVRHHIINGMVGKKEQSADL